MHAFAKKKASALLALIIALAGLAPLGSPVLAAPVAIDLCALEGSLTMPDAVTIPIWGFGVPSIPGDCSTATASLPGPELTVNEGDDVTINVTNALPTGHTIAFEAPGVSFDPGPNEAAPGDSVTLTFTASEPGTYLYQSGGDAGRQEAMGLYGALIVNSNTANQAYDDSTTAYNVAATLVLSQIDPNFNADPEGFDMYQYLATYWLINGKAYPETDAISVPIGQNLLLRYLNAGYDNTTMLLLGAREQVVARDGSLLNDPFSADAETIPAGATEDTIVTIPDAAPPSVNGFPLYNRQLHVTNGPASSPSYNPGGMMTFIVPLPAPASPVRLVPPAGSTLRMYLPMISG